MCSVLMRIPDVSSPEAQAARSWASGSFFQEKRDVIPLSVRGGVCVRITWPSVLGLGVQLRGVKFIIGTVPFPH